MFVFLISNFNLVLNVVRFLLGNSPGSEIYLPTFRNTLSVGGFKTFALFRMQSVFFWEFPRRLKFLIAQDDGTDIEF